MTGQQWRPEGARMSGSGGDRMHAPGADVARAARRRILDGASPRIEPPDTGGYGARHDVRR